MCYPCSENKGADQLRGYREADLRLCFHICKKPFFLMTRLIFNHMLQQQPTLTTSYALVICNHSPPAPGNSGDFDFLSSKTNPAKKPTLPFGKTTAVFPCSLLCFHYTAFFAVLTQTPGIFPPHPRDNAKVKTLLISSAIPHPPPPPLGLGGGWGNTD